MLPRHLLLKGEAVSDDFENAVDLKTSEQARAYLDAEQALGERYVLRVLCDVWSEENEASWCWFNGCHGCERELRAGEQGYVLARPLGDNPESTHVGLESYCSKECIERATQELADTMQRDILVGFHTI